MPAISVIIPVYNTAPFLDQCLQSVTAQTFQDIEIICVDNSSTDNSADILHRWAERDKRIKLFQSQNFGPGSGRNKGLDKAQGEYVLFLDSDDFLDTKACETLYQAAKAEDLDVAMCDFYEYHHQTGRTAPRNKAYELSCTHYLDNTKGNTVLDFVQFAFAFPFMAFKLVRREILERLRLRFPYGAAEDVTVCVSLLASCRRVIAKIRFNPGPLLVNKSFNCFFSQLSRIQTNCNGRTQIKTEIIIHFIRKVNI